MRLRLFHQLFLLITASALVAALAMATVLSLNLDRGFQDYLGARDAEQFAALGDAIEARLNSPGASVDPVEALRDIGRPAPLGRPPPPFPGHPPPFPSDEGPPNMSRGDPPMVTGGPPRGRPPPEDFGSRLVVVDPDGVQRAGLPLPSDADVPAPILRRELHQGNRVIGTLRLLPRGPTPLGVEARFLRSQYLGAAWLTALLLALALVPAWWLARLATTRIDELLTATTAIARGDFSARVAPGGGVEVAALGGNVNLMAASLERLDSARRRWLAEVSHELRTPLAVIRGELDALEDGVRPLSRAAIVSVGDEARRLSGLVDDLHFLAVSDLSGPPCHFASVDAAGLVAPILERFALAATKAGLALALAPIDTAPMIVRWDAGRIDQLLTNLLTNSLRYTDSPGRILVTLAADGEDIAITIDDSAPAVPPEHLQRLFEPLYRLDEARSRAHGGSGLGLAVCAAIVRAHGGSIVAEMSPLGGLRVAIMLPKDARQ
jgi:two-component system sensor histidine kinase BaeS